MQIRFFILLLLGFSLQGLSQGRANFDSLLDSAMKYSRTDTSVSLSYVQESLLIAKSEKSEILEIKANYCRAKIYFQNGIDLKSKEILLSTLPRAESLDDKQLIIQGYSQLALTEKLLGNSFRAIELFQKSSLVAGNAGYSDLKAKALYQIGSVYKKTSSLDSAMAYSVDALKTFESLNDTTEIIKSLYQIGNINVLAQNYNEAYETFNRAEPLAYALKDSTKIVDIYLHKGLVQQKNDQFEEAIENYKKGLEYIPAKGSASNTAILNGNIGSTLAQLGKYQEALPYLLRALEMKKANNSSIGSLCHTYLDLSSLYLNLENFQESIAYAEKVVKLTKESGDDYYRQYGYLYLSEALHTMGNDKKGYEYLLKYSDLKDSIFDESKSKQLQELQVAYEAEKKDAEIRSLDQERTIERTQKRFYLFAALVVLMLGLGVYRFQRAKTKKNIQLLEKEKEIDALKTNFFANISHEFRTPLTLILGPIQSKLETVKDGPERNELLMMERNAIRLHRLINDILDLAKSEEGKLELKNRPINLALIVKGLASSFQSLADIRGIDYSVVIDERLMDKYVLADQSKLETVLINLISNSFKFTPDGGFVSVRLAHLSGEEFQISVEDSGAGIPPNKLSRIFDRFYQVDDSRTRKNEGTGIGLAFSKELALLMGGELSAESVLGKGSTFKLNLRLERAEGVSKEKTAQMDTLTSSEIQLQDAILSLSQTEKEGFQNTELPILLLVEDNADVRAYVNSILKDSYHLVFAENGKVGRDKAFELIPDIIISDVMMPVMDGFEFCRFIKSDIRTSHIPLIMLTAKSSAESRIEGLETEADIYMSKPFNPKELKLQLRNLLSLHHNIQQKFKTSKTLLPESVNLNSAESKFLKKLGEIMESQYTNSDFSVQQLSDEIGMSRSQLHRKLNASTGESPSQFIRVYRLKIAEKMLESRTGSISEIAYNVGFNSVPYFNRSFLEQFGKRPGEVILE